MYPNVLLEGILGFYHPPPWYPRRLLELRHANLGHRRVDQRAIKVVHVQLLGAAAAD
jgi:hypothetical protein